MLTIICIIYLAVSFLLLLSLKALYNKAVKESEEVKQFLDLLIEKFLKENKKIYYGILIPGFIIFSPLVFAFAEITTLLLFKIPRWIGLSSKKKPDDQKPTVESEPEPYIKEISDRARELNGIIYLKGVTDAAKILENFVDYVHAQREKDEPVIIQDFYSKIEAELKKEMGESE